MRKLSFLLTLVPGLALFTGTARADIMQIEVIDNKTATTFFSPTQTILGGGATTSLTFSQAVTGATVNIDVALSNSPGAGGVSNLHLGYVASFSGMADFTILASATGYTVPGASPPPALFSGAFGVPVQDPPSLSAIAEFFAGNNTVFDTSVGASPILNPGQTVSASFSIPNPYDLVDGIRLTNSGGSFNSSDDFDVSSVVPEPATMAMLLAGMPVMGLGWLRARRKKK